MCNLGLYKVIVETAKKVGGPKVLIGLTMIVGYVAIRPIEGCIKSIMKSLKDITDNKEYEVSKHIKLQEDLELDIGDKFKVLAEDNNSILIEVIDNKLNPFLVDKAQLVKISNYS